MLAGVMQIRTTWRAEERRPPASPALHRSLARRSACSPPGRSALTVCPGSHRSAAPRQARHPWHLGISAASVRTPSARASRQALTPHARCQRERRATHTEAAASVGARTGTETSWPCVIDEALGGRREAAAPTPAGSTVELAASAMSAVPTTSRVEGTGTTTGGGSGVRRDNPRAGRRGATDDRGLRRGRDGASGVPG